MAEHAEPTYRHTPDMPEISGFGGGYESACQDMLEAGCKYLFAHPDADPQYSGMRGVYGIVKDENDDAKALDAVLIGACEGCSGAMHQAVVSRLLYIKKHGWDGYCEELRKPSAKSA